MAAPPCAVQQSCKQIFVTLSTGANLKVPNSGRVESPTFPVLSSPPWILAFDFAVLESTLLGHLTPVTTDPAVSGVMFLVLARSMLDLSSLEPLAFGWFLPPELFCTTLSVSTAFSLAVWLGL